MAKTGFLYRNGLGLVLIALMLASLAGQVFTGWQTENNELAEEGQNLLSIS
jgi:cytochrome b